MTHTETFHSDPPKKHNAYDVEEHGFSITDAVAELVSRRQARFVGSILREGMAARDAAFLILPDPTLSSVVGVSLRRSVSVVEDEDAGDTVVRAYYSVRPTYKADVRTGSSYDDSLIDVDLRVVNDLRKYGFELTMTPHRIHAIKEEKEPYGVLGMDLVLAAPDKTYKVEKGVSTVFADHVLSVAIRLRRAHLRRTQLKDIEKVVDANLLRQMERGLCGGK
jgi:hypothetical protein